jgi:hypothetical protein
MTLAILGSLAFRLTGREAHEWISMTSALLMVLHVAINRRALATLPKAFRLPGRRLETLVTAALLMALGVLIATGAMGSRSVFGLSARFDGQGVRRLHSLAAYWLWPLIGLHLGLRWRATTAAAGKAFGLKAPSPAGRFTRPALAAFLAAYGVWASFERDMGSKMLLGYSFDFWDPARAPVWLFTENLAILGLYALIGPHLGKAARRSHGLKAEG